MSSQPLGIGIIGAGRISRAHASATCALPETRLVGIADVEPERVAQAAEAYGCRGYDGYLPLLADPEVEAVLVGLPHVLHREATVDSLRAGKHVLLEKPMAMSVAECDAMIAAAEASGKTLMVAHSQQFFPVNVAVRRLVQQGGIGHVVMATDTWYKPFHEGVRPAWFLDDSQGGGMWSMNGSHMIDRLCYFLGDEVTAVKAQVGNPIFGLSTDMGIAFLQFRSGVCATIAHAGFREGVVRFEAEITGTEAQLKISGDRSGGTCFWRSRERTWEEVCAPALDLTLRPGMELELPVFAAEIREFALSVREQRPPAVTAEYGRHVVQVLEACLESSRTGREVVL